MDTGGGRTSKRVPHTKPPFTMADLRKAVPLHCFKRSLLRSSYHVVHDLFFVVLFYFIATTYFHHLSRPLRYLAWSLYIICQGSAITALWVIAHDCGHHAFSDYQWIDDTIGMILHTSLLTPYFSWKISHRRHHANTQSLDRDEAHVPKFKAELCWFDHLQNHPLGFCFKIIVSTFLGWPMYLLFNFTGRKYERFVTHFDPTSPIFSKGERPLVLVSNASVLTVAYGLYRLVLAKGLMWVMCIYGFPLLITNAFLMIGTYLNHTHAAVPHYDSTEWDWLRGALATIDREFAFNSVVHNVSEMHVMHHLFPNIPHYHGKEVTKVIKPILGDYYHSDGTQLFKALWRELNECVYIRSDEDDRKGVYWFDNKL